MTYICISHKEFEDTSKQNRVGAISAIYPNIESRRETRLRLINRGLKESIHVSPPQYLLGACLGVSSSLDVYRICLNEMEGGAIPNPHHYLQLPNPNGAGPRGFNPSSCFRDVSRLSAVWKACFLICTKPDPRSFAAKVSNRVGIYVKFLAVEEVTIHRERRMREHLALPIHVISQDSMGVDYAKIYKL